MRIKILLGPKTNRARRQGSSRMFGLALAVSVVSIGLPANAAVSRRTAQRLTLDARKFADGWSGRTHTIGKTPDGKAWVVTGQWHYKPRLDPQLPSGIREMRATPRSDVVTIDYVRIRDGKTIYSDSPRLKRDAVTAVNHREMFAPFEGPRLQGSARTLDRNPLTRSGKSIRMDYFPKNADHAWKIPVATETTHYYHILTGKVTRHSSMVPR